LLLLLLQTLAYLVPLIQKLYPWDQGAEIKFKAPQVSEIGLLSGRCEVQNWRGRETGMFQSGGNLAIMPMTVFLQYRKLGIKRMAVWLTWQQVQGHADE
jgi:hypothetical protein